MVSKPCILHEDLHNVYILWDIDLFKFGKGVALDKRSYCRRKSKGIPTSGTYLAFNWSNIICFICQTPYMMFTFMIYSFDHCSYLSYLCPVHYNILTVDRWILSYFGCCTVWSFSSQTKIAVNGKKSSIYYSEETISCTVKWMFELWSSLFQFFFYVFREAYST